MKAKQAAIINAYGSAWNLLTAGAQVFALENDGWVPGSNFWILRNVVECTPGAMWMDEDPQVCRPVSLRGIESNNGWTRLDERTPDDDGTYTVLTKSGAQFTKVRYLRYLPGASGGGFTYRDSPSVIACRLRDVSHYRPYVEILPPLY